MAIAETEPKKADADDTSTGGSKDTFGNGSKSPVDKDYLGNSSTKIYGLYYNIKDFAFSMPDGWDDKNIAIFIECCKEEIEEFRNPGEDENHVWHKIAKSGPEKSGNVKCFTVNSCLELAQCLKAYVIRNNKRIENEAFKKLYDDVFDLLQYFPGPAESTSKNVRHRSRSKSTEKKTDIYGKPISSVESESSSVNLKDLVTQYPGSSHQIDDLICMYCKQYKDKLPTWSATYTWNKISSLIMEEHGIKVDVKKRLDATKKKITKEVKKETDPKAKAKKFLALACDFVDFFDFMPPRTIKVKELLGIEETELLEYLDSHEEETTKTDDGSPHDDIESEREEAAENSSKIILNKEGGSEPEIHSVSESNMAEVEPSDGSHSSKRKGRKKKEIVEKTQEKDGNPNTDDLKASEEKLTSDQKNSNDSNLENIETEVTLKTHSSSPKVLEVEDESVLKESTQTNSETTAKVDKTNDTVEKSVSDINDKESENLSKKNNKPGNSNSDLKARVQENSGKTAEVEKEPNGPSEEAKITTPEPLNNTEEGPNGFTFENKYSLRSGREMIKYSNPKPKRNVRQGVKSQTKPQQTKNKQQTTSPKRVLPQRSARSKTKSYKLSEGETSHDGFIEDASQGSSPRRNSSPDLKGFPVPASVSPMYNFKRAYTQSLEKDGLEEDGFEDIDRNEFNMDPKRKKYFQENYANLHGKMAHEESPYVERLYRFRHKSNMREDYSMGYQSDSDGTGTIKNAVVMLRDIKEIGTPGAKANLKRSAAATNSPPKRGRPRTKGIVTPPKPPNISPEKGKYQRLKENDITLDRYDLINRVYLKNDRHRHDSQKPSTSSEMMRNRHLHTGVNQRMNQPTSLKSRSQLQENVSHLDELDASTAAILEKYKNRVEESPQSKAIMQLLPSSQSGSNSRSNDLVVMNAPGPQQGGPGSGMEVVPKPPAWFGNFVSDYRKHEMWKMHQMLKMQQELLDMENRKLAVLEQILGSLKKDS